MQVVPKAEVERQLSELRVGGFGHIIDNLIPGSALRIHAGEWRFRTPVPFYFLRYNRNGKKVVSVRKIGPKDYLVIKL